MRVRGKAQLLYPIRGKSCTVDDSPAAQFAAICFHQIAKLGFPDSNHSGSQHGFHPIGSSVFKGGNAQLPRVHRSGGRGIERACHTRCQHRLHCLCLPPGQKLQTRHAIADTLLPFSPELGQALLIIGHQQGAAAGKGNFQFTAQIIKRGISTNRQFRLPGTGFVVISRIDDGRVCPGNACTDIQFLFNQHDRQIPAHQIPGRKAAQNPSPNNRNIYAFHRGITCPGLSTV